MKNLTNFPNIRIQKYPQGWVVEIQKKKWYGRKYWVHIISVSGMRDTPWYFRSPDVAFEEACKLFRWDILYGLHRIEETQNNDDKSNQTAVEWMYERIKNSLLTVGYTGTKHAMPNIYAEAKEMEKKQIVDAADRFGYIAVNTNLLVKNGEEYYYDNYGEGRDANRLS